MWTSPFKPKPRLPDPEIAEAASNLRRAAAELRATAEAVLTGSDLDRQRIREAAEEFKRRVRRNA